MRASRWLLMLLLGGGCGGAAPPSGQDPGVDTDPNGCPRAGGERVILDGAQAFDDLQVALDAATPGSELRLCPGFYRGPLVAPVPVRLIAIADHAVTVLAGSSDDAPVLTVPGDSELVGLTVQSGHVGVRMSSAGSLRIEASRITGNHAQRGAGLVVAENATATLVGTEITGNVARAGGGGVWVQPGGTLELSDGSVVSDNQAGEFGGGVWLQEAHLIGGAVIRNRVAASPESLPRYEGGAVILEAEAFGGAGVALSGTGSVSATEIAHNEGPGGSLSVTRGTATLADVWVHDNDARPAMGGGLGVADGTVLGEGATRFERNAARLGGGGVLVKGTIVGVTFAENEGGGLDMVYGHLEHVVIRGNTSDFGAGLISWGTGRLEHVIIEGNQSSGWAGGVSVVGVARGEATFEIVDSSIAGNAAEQDGGGLYLWPSSPGAPLTLWLKDTAVTGNSAGRNGGGLYLDNTAFVNGGAIAGNTAFAGGGAYVFGSGALLSVEGADLGAGEGDNTPDDVRTRSGDAYAGFGAGATFACDRHGCEPTP